jgi:uncharacterized membrane protein YpjA
MEALAIMGERAIMLNQDIMEWLEAITDLSHCFMAIKDLLVDIYTLAVGIGILVMSIGTLMADIDIGHGHGHFGGGHKRGHHRGEHHR